jgi:hypothetical protein
MVQRDRGSVGHLIRAIRDIRGFFFVKNLTMDNTDFTDKRIRAERDFGVRMVQHDWGTVQRLIHAIRGIRGFLSRWDLDSGIWHSPDACGNFNGDSFPLAFPPTHRKILRPGKGVVPCITRLGHTSAGDVDRGSRGSRR